MTSRISWNHVILVCLYSLIMVVGFVTNLVLTYLIFTREFMRAKYIFTVSISIAHIVLCAIVIPIIITYIITHDVTLERPCHVTVCFTLGMTSYSMLTTAVRRALALSERYRYADFTYRGKVANVLLICLVSLAMAVPFVFYQGEGRCMYDVLSPLDTREAIRNTSFIDAPYNMSSVNGLPPLLKPLRLAAIETTTSVPHDSLILRDIPTKFVPFKRNCANGVCVRPIDWTSTNNIAKFPNYFTSDSDTRKSLLETEETNQSFITKNNGFVDNGVWIYSVILLFVQVIGPAIACLIVQTHVYIGIKRRPNQAHWTKELRITKQHICMVLIVLICWLPILTMNIWSGEPIGRAKLVNIPMPFWDVFQVIAVSYVVYFPMLYYVLNAHIHREFKIWLDGWRQQQQQQPEMV